MKKKNTGFTRLSIVDCGILKQPYSESYKTHKKKNYILNWICVIFSCLLEITCWITYISLNVLKAVTLQLYLYQNPTSEPSCGNTYGLLAHIIKVLCLQKQSSLATRMLHIKHMVVYVSKTHRVRPFNDIHNVPHLNIIVLRVKGDGVSRIFLSRYWLRLHVHNLHIVKTQELLYPALPET